MVKIDIEMPTYCYDCPCYNGETGRCNITGDSAYDKRPFDCPLKEEKSGKWRSELVKRNDWKGDMQSYYQPISCSLCHNPQYKEFLFCPECGAKMEGEEKRCQ